MQREKQQTTFVHLGFTVDKCWLKTSQNPCKCHSAAVPVADRVPLETIMAYKNDAVIGRIATDLTITMEKAGELFDDLKRFLWAASLSDDNTIPSPLIDEAWHAFILFTVDYADFCTRFFGEFMHHQPHTAGEGYETNTVTIPSIEHFHRVLGGKPSANWDYINIEAWKAA